MKNTQEIFAIWVSTVPKVKKIHIFFLAFFCLPPFSAFLLFVTLFTTFLICWLSKQKNKCDLSVWSCYYNVHSHLMLVKQAPHRLGHAKIFVNMSLIHLPNFQSQRETWMYVKGYGKLLQGLSSFHQLLYNRVYLTLFKKNMCHVQLNLIKWDLDQIYKKAI